MLVETTTDAATTTEGASSQAATTDAAAAPATAATTDAAAQQQTSQGQQTQDAANTAEGDGKEGDKATQDTKPVVPEKYEINFPEGLTLDEDGVSAFSEFAKDAGLSNEQAQLFADKLAPALQARQTSVLAKAVDAWTAESKADKEFGGDKLNENLAVAQKAVKEFGTPELNKLLKETGLQNHPEIIRAFYRAGKAISEDRFVPSGAGARAAGKDPAKSLYPNQ